MTRTLTILASDPREPPENDAAIAAVKAVLDARTDKANHIVAEAPSVEQLTLRIRDHSPPGAKPDRIQIIGHGSSGMLSLGYSWVERYSDGPQGLYYVLDSNPWVHGVLAGIVAPATEVWLLGCAVGDGGAGPQTTVARGPTLLFDLAQMWGCTVSAPTGVISSKDFDLEGVFTGPLASVQGFKFTQAVNPVPVIAAGPPLANLPVKFTRLRRAPILGPRSGVLTNFAVSPLLNEELRRLYRREVQLPPLLALPEIVFDGQWQGAIALCEIIANGRLLRITTATHVMHFQIVQDLQPSLPGVIGRLLAPAFKPPRFP